MKRRTKITLLALSGLLVVGIFTYRCALEHRSCVGCRGFSYVTARSVFGVPFGRSERRELPSGIPAGHVHDWWRYSLHTSTAVSRTFACKPYRFADHKND
jgi:hypothetical protein